MTFDPVIDSTGQTGTFYTGTPHTNPLFASGGNDDPYDVAVIVLDEAPPITPAHLPTAGLLDALKADHSLTSTRFTAVGYGTTRDSMKKGWQGILDNSARKRRSGLQDADDSMGRSSTCCRPVRTTAAARCYGDSGGPHFVHLDGVETDIVAATTITGDASASRRTRITAWTRQCAGISRAVRHLP